MKLLALLLVVAPAVAAADSTKTISDIKGKCSVTVPATWKGDRSFASSPDKKQTITVSAPKDMDSFDSVKSTAKQIYANDKVTKDSATEFEMEGKSLNNKPNVYRAIPTSEKGAYCIVEVTYESGTADNARTLARTVAPKK